MPKNQFQKVVFAFITVFITVHAYVFYSLYVINGTKLMEINQTTSVLEAINNQGGVYMIGRYVPIWVIVLVEFTLAFVLELIIGSPLSFKLTSNIFDFKNTQPVIIETVIIFTTVVIMCPLMSFIAAILYYPFYMGINFFTLLANWLKLICFNFPFAFFTQLFFIQPLVRIIFQFIFENSLKIRKHC